MKKRSKKLFVALSRACPVGIGYRIRTSAVSSKFHLVAVFYLLGAQWSAIAQSPSPAEAAVAVRRDKLIELLKKEFAGPLPSDAEMIIRLHQTMDCLEAIIRMSGAEAAKGIWRISPVFLKTKASFLPTPDEQRKLLPDDRWNKYRELFRCAGLDKGNSGITIASNGITFLAENRGFAGSGVSKSFFWARKPPAPLSETLDRLSDAQKASTPGSFFKHVQGSWYLELDVD